MCEVLCVLVQEWIALPMSGRRNLVVCSVDNGQDDICDLCHKGKIFSDWLSVEFQISIGCVYVAQGIGSKISAYDIF